MAGKGKPLVQNKKIILASGSPRRKQLLSVMNVDFEAVPPDADESFDAEISADEAAKHVASKKADEVAHRYPDCAVIAADTIVVVDDKILGKPSGEDEAFYMLKTLSGRWHEVITGVCIEHMAKRTIFSCKTAVHFTPLGDDFIKWYISTKEPMDKAGAYGIQGYGAMLVDRIDGDFYNVMGFPISMIMDELRKLGIYDMGRG